MPRVSDRIVISCDAEQFLELVMDIQRYATIDSKLGRFRYVRRDGDGLRFKCQAIMPGLPAPRVGIVVDARRDGDTIDVKLAPRPHNLLFHQLMRFEAGFRVDRVAATRIVVHRHFFVDLRLPFRPLLEPTLRRTLPQEIARELQGAKTLIESPADLDRS